MIQHPENESLKSKAIEVLKKHTHGMGFFEFKFLGFDVNIEQIDQFSIMQDFSGSYGDAIACAFTLLPKDLITVVRAYQNLRCSITFTKAENHTGVILNEYDPLQWEFRVLLENPQDLLKKISSREFMKPENEPDSEQYQPVRVPISMQLITDQEYELRHIEFTDNLNKVTMEKTLHHIANIFKCQEVLLTPPDNTREYDHVPLPPMLNFSNAFSFLQERYGVYNYDLGVYLSQQKLYIYPKNENHPKQPLAPGILHIYKIGTDQYPGSDGYTAMMGSDIHALCTKPIDIQDKSEANAEEIGNATVVTRTDMAIDTNREIIEKGVDQKPEEAITVVNPNSNTAVPGIQNAKYITSQDNVHQLMSTMSANDCAIASIPILYLDPYSLYPNHPCILHYEENGEYKSVNGTVIGCAYAMAAEGKPSRVLYGFQCSIAARFVPDKKENSVS